MASVQDIKRRVRSVRNTRKITKAMELVAGAKLRRAATRIEAMRPYADRMLELMTGTARASASMRGLPLLQSREVQTVLIVPFTADRGLAGGFNAQIMRHAFALERRLKAEGKTVRFAVVGKKGASTLRFRRYELDGVFQGFTDRPEYGDAQAIGHRLAELYTGEDVDQVIAIYNHFISPLVQRVTEQDVLPISEQLLAREERAGARGGRARADRRLHLRARAGGDPRPAAARLPRDRALPRAARVGRVRAGRAHDRDAERLEQRGRADRPAHARDEPRAAVGDHAGDPRGRRGRGRSHRLTELVWVRSSM